MNRRQFLSLCGLAAVVPALPVGETIIASPVYTIPGWATDGLIGCWWFQASHGAETVNGKSITGWANEGHQFRYNKTVLIST